MKCSDTDPALPSPATNLCYGEKNVYTSEVLAVVMQQLMEQNPLPMLLMRTVIQSLSMYPRLGGFVMNILSRLIVKQVGPTSSTPLLEGSLLISLNCFFQNILYIVLISLFSCFNN